MGDYPAISSTHREWLSAVQRCFRRAMEWTVCLNSKSRDVDVETVADRRSKRLQKVRLAALVIGLGAFVGAALWYDSPKTYWVRVTRIMPESGLLCVTGSDIASLDAQGARGEQLCGTYVEGGNGIDFGQLDERMSLLMRVEEIAIGSARRTVLVGIPAAGGGFVPE